VFDERERVSARAEAQKIGSGDLEVDVVASLMDVEDF
jgi:hypothetical protein